MIIEEYDSDYWADANGLKYEPDEYFDEPEFNLKSEIDDVEYDWEYEYSLIPF